MKIWKYDIPPKDYFVLNMPRYAFILTLQKQGEIPCLWVQVPNAEYFPSKEIEYEEREFSVVGTGWEIGPMEIGNAGYYVGTWQAGPFVWHLYEKCHESYPYIG
jgi:hypothetical protein